MTPATAFRVAVAVRSLSKASKGLALSLMPSNYRVSRKRAIAVRNLRTRLIPVHLTRMQRPLCLLIALVALVAARAQAAQTNNPFGTSNPYESCVAAINKNAADAFEMALSWRTQGGGLPADHCAALALLALDEPGEAASRLNAL